MEKLKSQWEDNYYRYEKMRESSKAYLYRVYGKLSGIYYYQAFFKKTSPRKTHEIQPGRDAKNKWMWVYQDKGLAIETFEEINQGKIKEEIEYEPNTKARAYNRNKKKS